MAICDPCIYDLGSQQIAPACVQSNLLGLGIGSWCCVVEPMLTELVKTTTTTTTITPTTFLRRARRRRLFTAYHKEKLRGY